MKWKTAGIAGGVVGLLGLSVVGGWTWARASRNAVSNETWETHEVDFPVPFPLTAEERATLSDGADDEPVDAAEEALTRARRRGKHLVEAIYVCVNCHGEDFAGGTMMNDAAIGHVTGPNLTPGGAVADYTVADWDRAVRHGVLPGGRTSWMPVGDFDRMSDRELSDIIAYLRSVPAREGGERILSFGPLGTWLVATGSLMPDVYTIHDHHADHAVTPPPEGPTAEYGAHIAQVCTGCHREGLEGGPMPFGPPDWPPAPNLTPHEEGLADWSYDDFVAALKQGRRPDGSALGAPMNEVVRYTAQLTELETRAMWTHLTSLPPTPTGN